LLRVPPGIVWVALAGVGLWISVRERRSALLLGIGPVVATYLAGAVGVYPFADRLVLFLLPVVLLLVAAVLVARQWVGLALGACLLIPQLVLSLRPSSHEDMRRLARAVATERSPDDAVYVYYGGGPAFAYYAKTDVPVYAFDLGGCHRGDWPGYRAELDRYHGRRLWLVVGHAFRGEDSLFTGYLGATRATLTTVTANDAFARLYAPDTGGVSSVAHALLPVPRPGLTCRK
jgi:hypothetical protein